MPLLNYTFILFCFRRRMRSSQNQSQITFDKLSDSGGFVSHRPESDYRSPRSDRNLTDSDSHSFDRLQNHLNNMQSIGIQVRIPSP